MAKYLVKETSYINNMLAQAGDIVDYEVPEGTTISKNLEPVSAAKDIKHANDDVDINQGKDTRRANDIDQSKVTKGKTI
jgi:hypothetical protein